MVRTHLRECFESTDTRQTSFASSCTWQGVSTDWELLKWGPQCPFCVISSVTLLLAFPVRSVWSWNPCSCVFQSRKLWFPSLSVSEKTCLFILWFSCLVGSLVLSSIKWFRGRFSLVLLDFGRARPPSAASSLFGSWHFSPKNRRLLPDPSFLPFQQQKCCQSVLPW